MADLGLESRFLRFERVCKKCLVSPPNLSNDRKFGKTLSWYIIQPFYCIPYNLVAFGPNVASMGFRAHCGVARMVKKSDTKDHVSILYRFKAHLI